MAVQGSEMNIAVASVITFSALTRDVATPRPDEHIPGIRQRSGSIDRHLSVRSTLPVTLYV